MKIKLTRLSLLLWCKLAILLALGCANDYSKIIAPEFTPLIDEGILNISHSNPNLATNIFLEEEARTNRYLRRFLKDRGLPEAIKISSEGTTQLTMNLYYSNDLELFRAIKRNPEGGNSFKTEWLITGPEPIERLDYQKLKNQTIHTSQKSLYNEPLPIENHKDPLPPMLPPKKISVRKTNSKIPPKIDQKSLENFKPKNLDQEALALSRGIALRNEKGDLIHKVSELKQTISDIAAWYTGTASNAEKVAKYNARKITDYLVLGEEILIPSNLIKRALIYKFSENKR
jgi:hypothetical protein